MTLYSILPGSLTQKWGSLAVTGYGLLIAGIATSLITRVWRESFTLDMNAVLGIAGITVIGTVLAYTMYLQGVADIGADYASLLSCTEPVAATVFAALLLGTEFLPVDIAGFAAIITSVLLLSVKTGRKAGRAGN